MEYCNGCSFCEDHLPGFQPRGLDTPDKFPPE
jgi:hypothetical protein